MNNTGLYLVLFFVFVTIGSLALEMELFLTAKTAYVISFANWVLVIVMGYINKEHN